MRWLSRLICDPTLPGKWQYISGRIEENFDRCRREWFDACVEVLNRRHKKTRFSSAAPALQRIEPSSELACILKAWQLHLSGEYISSQKYLTNSCTGEFIKFLTVSVAGTDLPEIAAFMQTFKQLGNENARAARLAKCVVSYISGNEDIADEQCEPIIYLTHVLSSLTYHAIAYAFDDSKKSGIFEKLIEDWRTRIVEDQVIRTPVVPDVESYAA